MICLAVIISVPREWDKNALRHIFRFSLLTNKSPNIKHKNDNILYWYCSQHQSRLSGRKGRFFMPAQCHVSAEVRSRTPLPWVRLILQPQRFSQLPKTWSHLSLVILFLSSLISSPLILVTPHLVFLVSCLISSHHTFTSLLLFFTSNICPHPNLLKLFILAVPLNCSLLIPSLEWQWWLSA